jgi:hypothetical protein
MSRVRPTYEIRQAKRLRRLQGSNVTADSCLWYKETRSGYTLNVELSRTYREGVALLLCASGLQSVEISPNYLAKRKG